MNKIHLKKQTELLNNQMDRSKYSVVKGSDSLANDIMLEYRNKRLEEFVFNNKIKYNFYIGEDLIEEKQCIDEYNMCKYIYDFDEYSLLKKFEKMCDEVLIFNQGEYYLLFEKEKAIVYIYISLIKNKPSKVEINLQTYDLKPVKKLTNKIQKLIFGYRRKKLNKVMLNMNWWFNSYNGIDNSYLTSTYTDIIHKESYPYINDMDEYIDKFINSSENILLLKGLPGTGKSRFIRYLLNKIAESKNEKIFNYNFSTDQTVIENITIYLDSLKRNNPLVLEDIDFHLKARTENNSTMYSLLNVSDGIHVNNNKMIISTNMANVNNIDEAFLREGRCFDVLEFRKLTFKESKVLIKKLTKKKIQLENRTYSLSEIYSIVKGDTGKAFRNRTNPNIITKVGFRV